MSTRQILEAALDRGLTQISIKTDGCALPEFLMDNRGTILNISKNFGEFIAIDDKGITADLSFSGATTRCFIPFESIETIKNIKRDLAPKPALTLVKD